MLYSADDGSQTYEANTGAAPPGNEMLYSANSENLDQTYEANTGAAPPGNEMLYSADSENLDQTYEVPTGAAPTNGGMLMYSADFGSAALKAAPAKAPKQKVNKMNTEDADEMRLQQRIWALERLNSGGSIQPGQASSELYSEAAAAKPQTGVFVLQGAHTAGEVTNMGATTTESLYSDEGMQAGGEGKQPRCSMPCRAVHQTWPCLLLYCLCSCDQERLPRGSLRTFWKIILVCVRTHQHGMHIH